MRPRPHTVALLVAVLASVGSLVIVPVSTDGPDAGAAPADSLGTAVGAMDAVRPAGGRLVAPALLLLVVLPAVAAAAAPVRRHAVAPAVVRAPARGTPPRRVHGRAPPPRFPSSTR